MYTVHCTWCTMFVHCTLYSIHTLFNESIDRAHGNPFPPPPHPPNVINFGDIWPTSEPLTAEVGTNGTALNPQEL